MSIIKSKNDVSIREINGELLSGPDKPQLSVCNHDNHASLVILKLSGTNYTVSVKELRMAITNAENAH